MNSSEATTLDEPGRPGGEPPHSGAGSQGLTGGHDAMKWALAASVAGASLAVDLLSKRLVRASDFGSYNVLPFLTIDRQVNRGVAFGLFWERYGLILAAAFVALGVILLYLRLESRPILAGLAGGLLLGGSLGNLWERVTKGEVTDFLRVPHWPTFNLADVFIVAGVILVAVSLLWPPAKEERVE